MIIGDKIYYITYIFYFLKLINLPNFYLVAEKIKVTVSFRISFDHYVIRSFRCFQHL